MSTDSPLTRQWTLLRLLSSSHYGMSIAELSREAEVSQKTIRRDIETFRNVGFPIEEAKGDFGKKTYRLPADQQPPLRFPFDEALALYMGRRFLDPLAGTPFWEAANKAFKKIRSMFAKEAIRYVEELAGSIHQTTFGASDYSAKADEIDQIMIAIEDRKPLIIAYQPERATEPVEYEIYPYAMVYHKGSLYVVAWSRDSDAIRHFKVNRLAKIEQSSELRFEVPKDFDIREHLAGSFGIYHGSGRIVVKAIFSPKVARYVSESKWHPSQQLNPRRDGALEVGFELATTAEVKQWLMSFGAEVEVLEPRELRDQMVESARKVLEVYERSKKRADAQG